MKSYKKYDDEHTGKVLYDLLFNKKVKKLGNIDVTHYKNYVVINDKKRKKNDYKKNTG